MNRALLNLLSGVVLLFGSAMVLGNLITFWLMLRKAPSARFPLPHELPPLIVFVFGAVVCALGSYMVYCAFRHLIRPDAKTARDVVSFGICVAFLAGLSPFISHQPYLALATIVGLVAIRYVVLRRLASKLAAGHSTP